MASFEAIYWALPGGVPPRSRERLAALAAETFPPSAGCAECATWCLAHPHAHDAAIRLLREVHALGAEIAVRRIGSPAMDLGVRDPGKTLTAEKRAEIAELRDGLITLLLFGPVLELTPAEFARSASMARFHTKSGPVLMAADNVDPCHPQLRDPEGAAVYHVRDLPQLPDVRALWKLAQGSSVRAKEGAP